MPTLTKLLSTINTEYRNTYSTDQKVEWMNTVQRQIFQKVPQEALPFQFETAALFSYYPLPDDCESNGPKVVTIETKAGSGKYRTLRFISITSNEKVGDGMEFYSIQERNIFINPQPTATDEGRKINMIYTKQPAELSASSLGVVPDLEENFHELLILGVLERIARARGENDDKSNFASDFNALLLDYERQYKLRQPEYYKTKDVMPSRRRGLYGRSGGGSNVSDLLPY